MDENDQLYLLYRAAYNKLKTTSEMSKGIEYAIKALLGAAGGIDAGIDRPLAPNEFHSFWENCKLTVKVINQEGTEIISLTED